MTKEIKFKETGFFTGRNGTFKQSGLELMTTGDKEFIMLSPFTSKGKIGNCCITIPIDRVYQLIQGLQEMTQGKSTY